jgi:molybdate transport system ATP-binding protein
LARALVVEPRLLLLDEPLAALDSDLKSRILPYLMRVREERGTPMLYVTHHIGEALALADGAMVVNKGRLEAQGEAARVLTPAVLAKVHRGATYENVVHGTIVDVSVETGIASLAIARPGRAPSFLLAVPATEGLEVGQHATYRLASEDLLLLRDAPGPISARNLFRAEVIRIESAGHEAIAHLEAEGSVWRAQLTPAAVTELTLAPRRAVWVAIKTVAFELLAAGAGSRAAPAVTDDDDRSHREPARRRD